MINNRVRKYYFNQGSYNKREKKKGRSLHIFFFLSNYHDIFLFDKEKENNKRRLFVVVNTARFVFIVSIEEKKIKNGLLNSHRRSQIKYVLKH
jgi:hypothetical protein